MLTLAIETSCDDTSAAVVDGTQVKSNVISSQVAKHKRWGGVVPMLAKREHASRIEFVLAQALELDKLAAEIHQEFEPVPDSIDTDTVKLQLTKTQQSYDDTNPERVGDLKLGKLPDMGNPGIELIAVTVGPGLAPSLEIGLQAAKQLAVAWGLPLVATNHMEGHLWSARLDSSHTKLFPSEDEFPVLGFLASGGHTDLHLVNRVGEYKLIGKTLDDAIGEAFDKVSVMLGLGYPGGKALEQLAKEATNTAMFSLPIPMKNSGDLNFSYAGLKTAALYKLQEIQSRHGRDIPRETAANFAAAFQNSIVDSVVIKLRAAIKAHPNLKSLYLGGGVVNNSTLVAAISELSEDAGLDLHTPKREYLLDNAAMIALAGQMAYEQGRGVHEAGRDLSQVERLPNLKLAS